MIGVYVDFKKAFDSVSHDILLQKLLGIRGLALNWFSPYLHDRKQFVSVNGINSDLQKYVHLVFLRDQSVALSCSSFLSMISIHQLNAPK